MSAKLVEPQVCKHCVAQHGELARQEVSYVQKNADGTRVYLCSVHAQLVAAVGILMDRVKRQEPSTYRPFEAESVWANRRHCLADDPAYWTHEAKRPGRHNRIARNSWHTGQISRATGR